MVNTCASTLVISALLSGAVEIARAECPPTAVPVGEPVLVQSLTDRLVASGITTTARVGCPFVRVNVEQRGVRVHLRVLDAYQRLGEREVQDVATAAAIIESWTLQEINPGALASGPEIAVTAVVTPAGAAPTVAASVSGPGSWLGAGGRSSIGDDGSTWLGGTVAGCHRVAWACLGGSLGFTSQTASVKDTATGSHRSLAIDAMARVDVPWQWGHVTVSPGVAVGYGWDRIEQQHHDAHAMPFAVASSHHALRVGAHLVVSRSFGRGVALFGELLGELAAVRTDASSGGPGALAGLALGARFESP